MSNVPTAVIPPPPISVQRAPACSAIQPRSGAPMGVPPMKTARYKAMTRPRIAGSAAIWTNELAAVINVIDVMPATGRTRANVR